jgi:hypothetical protein
MMEWPKMMMGGPSPEENYPAMSRLRSEMDSLSQRTAGVTSSLSKRGKLPEEDPELIAELAGMQDEAAEEIIKDQLVGLCSQLR